MSERESLVVGRIYRLSLRLRASRYQRARWVGWMLFLRRYQSFSTFAVKR